MKKYLFILALISALVVQLQAVPVSGNLAVLTSHTYTDKAEYNEAMKRYNERYQRWKNSGKQGRAPTKPVYKAPPAQETLAAFKDAGTAIGNGINSGVNAFKEKVIAPTVKYVGEPVVQKLLKPMTNAVIMPVINNTIKPAASLVNDNLIQPLNNAVVQPALNGINNGLAAAANSDNGFLKVLGKTGQVAMAGAQAMGQVMTAPIRLPIETAKTAVKTAEAISKGDTTGALLGGLQMKLDRDGVSRVTDMGKTWENSKKNVDKAVPGLGTVGGMVVESVPVIGDAVSAAGSAYKVQEAVKKGKYDEALGEAALAGVGFIGKGAGKAAAGATHLATTAAARGAKGIGGSRVLVEATKAATKTESGILKTIGTKLEGAAQSVGGLAAKTDSTVAKTVATKLESKGDSLAKLANRADDAIAKATNTGAQDVAFANKMLNKLDVTTVADTKKLATTLNRVEKATEIVDMTQKVGDIKQAIDYATGAANPDDDDDDDDKKDDKPADDPNANRALALAPVNNNGGAAQAAPVNTNPVVAPNTTHIANIRAAKSFNSFKAAKAHSPATFNRVQASLIQSINNVAVVSKGVIAPAPAPQPLAQAAPLPPQNSGGGNPNTPAPAAASPGAHVAGGFEYIFKFFNDDDDDDTIHISSTTLTDLNQNDVDITGNPDDASFGPIIVPKGSHGVTVKGGHYGVTSPNDIRGTMRVVPGGGGAAVHSGGDQKFHLYIRDTRNPHDTQTLHVHAK